MAPSVEWWSLTPILSLLGGGLLLLVVGSLTPMWPRNLYALWTAATAGVATVFTLILWDNVSDNGTATLVKGALAFDHLALRVDLDRSGSWLVDVGFGRHSHYPLRLDTRTDQVDPGGTFRLADSDDGDLDVIRDGQPQYRVEARPRTLADFEPTCWWHQTSPRSHFTHGPVCSRLTETGRVTLSDRTLVQTTGDRHQEHTLTDDAEILAAYRTWFGIVLQRVPGQPAATPATALPPARPGQTAPASAGLHHRGSTP